MEKTIGSEGGMPLNKLTGLLLRLGVEIGAKLMIIYPHLTEGSPKVFCFTENASCEVRIICPAGSNPLPAICSRIKIMSELSITMRGIPQIGGLNFSLKEGDVNSCVVTTIPYKGGEAVSISFNQPLIK